MKYAAWLSVGFFAFFTMKRIVIGPLREKYRYNHRRTVRIRYDEKVPALLRELLRQEYRKLFVEPEDESAVCYELRVNFIPAGKHEGIVRTILYDKNHTPRKAWQEKVAA